MYTTFKQYVEVGDLVTTKQQYGHHGEPCLVVGIKRYHSDTVLDVMLPTGAIMHWKISTLTQYPLDDVYGNWDLYIDKSLTYQPYRGIE